MLPYKTLLPIDRGNKTPIYQQLVAQLIALIRQGILRRGQKMPSSREMSTLLGVHRTTISQVYDELQVQGWLETKKASSTFVARHLPDIQPEKLSETSLFYPTKAGFDYERKSFLERPLIKSTEGLHLDDGFPDPRLVPLEDLASAYKRNLVRGNTYQRLGYGETKGTVRMRQQLVQYLNETRGLQLTEDNIMVVRGTVMGIYLATLAFVRPSDKVVIAWPSWGTARVSFQQAGAQVLTVPVDTHGMVVDELEAMCEKHTVRMVYVTPHHHYPTTVLMRADRRMKLLRLAQRYRFILFEDDYDYDFHYQSKPLLPLASADKDGVVLYSGSFTKTISPAFRVGYLVAPSDVIDYLSYYRRLIDRQGDNVLENAIADLLQDGIIQKYLRKALREYRMRRDHFCRLLSEQLPKLVQFQSPEGGMAVWATFDPTVDMDAASQRAFRSGLYFSSGSPFNNTDTLLNGTRLGFASSTIEELTWAMELLKQAVEGKG